MTTAALVLVAALAVLAGAGVARRAFGPLLDDEGRLGAAALVGLLVLAAGALAGACAGHVAAGTFAALALGCAALGRRGFAELRDAVRVSGARWLGWLAVAAVWTWLWHGRHVRFAEDGGVAWRGTLGWETWIHVEFARAVDQGWPLRRFGADGPLDYHAAANAAALGLARTTGADLVVVLARALPFALAAVAFETHRAFLRLWFPAGRAVTLAALLPAVVGDLDVWLRAVGGTPVPEFEHRLSHSFAVSPSFVLGQSQALLAVGLAVRAARAGAVSARHAAGIGGLLGLVVASKLPSFATAAVGAAALLPWFARRCGARAAAAAAAGTALAAGASLAVFFPSLGGAGAETSQMGVRWAPLHPFAAERVGGAGVVAILALSAWWIVQTLGPRALRLGETMRTARADPAMRAVLASLAAGAAIPLLVEIGPGEEERYAMRCGGAAALLVAGAAVLRDVSAGARRALVETVVLALFCAGTVWMLRPQPMEAALTADQVAGPSPRRPAPAVPAAPR